MKWRTGWRMFAIYLLLLVASTALIWRLPEGEGRLVGRVALVVGALCLALAAARRATRRGRN